MLHLCVQFQHFVTIAYLTMLDTCEENVDNMVHDWLNDCIIVIQLNQQDFKMVVNSRYQILQDHIVFKVYASRVLLFPFCCHFLSLIYFSMVFFCYW